MEKLGQRAGYIFATLGGAIALIKTATADLTELATQMQSWETQVWVAVLAVLIIGGIALILVSRRHSILRQPEALRLNRTNRAHLAGREDDIGRLIPLCRAHPLVFLVGTSGAGKSALLQAGLAQDLKADSGLLPIYVETLDGPDWEGAPQRAVAVAVQAAPALSAAERERIGWDGPLDPANCPAALAEIRSALGRTPLLILDQFDDYQNVNRQQFLPDGSWLQTDELCGQNTFWRVVRDQLQANPPSMHVLIVTRKDAADGLGCAHFIQPKTYSLDRLSAHEIGPLLARLTETNDGKPVIENPESGWTDLCHRLEADLTQEGRVLPQQLKIVLAALATLPNRRLSLRTYDRAEGARGLEAQFIETAVRDTADLFDQSRAGVREALVKLVDRAGYEPKTVAESEGTLLEIINPSNPKAARGVLESLEQREVLRQRAKDGPHCTQWQLDHDYLACAVLEADRRANRWTHRLEAGARALAAAKGPMSMTWRARWKALLPVGTQIAFLMDRLLNRFRYGEFRGYARLSTLRVAPYVLTLAVMGTIGALQWRQLEHDRIETAFQASIKAFTFDNDLTDLEFQALRAIAAEDLGFHKHFAMQILTDRDHARAFVTAPEQFARALLGTSPIMHTWTRDTIRDLAQDAGDDWDALLPTAFLMAYYAGAPEILPVEAWVQIIDTIKSNGFFKPHLSVSRFLNGDKYVPLEPYEALLDGFHICLTRQAPEMRGTIVHNAVSRLLTLTQELPPSNNGPNTSDPNLLVLSQTLTHDTAGREAPRLLAALRQTSQLEKWKVLAAAFKIVAKYLDDQFLAEETGKVMVTLEEENNDYDQKALYRLLAVISEDLGSDAVKKLCPHILQLMSQVTDADNMKELCTALKNMISHLEEGTFFEIVGISGVEFIEYVIDLCKKFKRHPDVFESLFSIAAGINASLSLSEAEAERVLKKYTELLLFDNVISNSTISEEIVYLSFRSPANSSSSTVLAGEVRRVLNAIPVITDASALRNAPNVIKALAESLPAATKSDLAEHGFAVMDTIESADALTALAASIRGLVNISLWTQTEGAVEAVRATLEQGYLCESRAPYNAKTDCEVSTTWTKRLATELIFASLTGSRDTLDDLFKEVATNMSRIGSGATALLAYQIIDQGIDDYRDHSQYPILFGRFDRAVLGAEHRQALKMLLPYLNTENLKTLLETIERAFLNTDHDHERQVLADALLVLRDRVSPTFAGDFAKAILAVAVQPAGQESKSSLYEGIAVLAPVLPSEGALFLAKDIVAQLIDREKVDELDTLGRILEVLADHLPPVARHEAILFLLDQLRTSSDPDIVAAKARGLAALTQYPPRPEYQDRLNAMAFAALRNPLITGAPVAVVVSVLEGSPPQNVRKSDIVQSAGPQSRADLMSFLQPESLFSRVISDGLSPLIVWAEVQQAAGRLNGIDLDAPLSLEP
ncbi:hypothetical protein SAMN05421720_1116 [Rhodospira trueperi]|uniref:Novel STAND NTPase 1 domain-containing protein n=1 Tax=Rhodospira trueperi TaxID=69960 RepID=A0A1G7FCC1_9PROT|nr:ABC transporter ATP-binding protein [Rhodospira trueperi]SDE73580.1 hypothetical protein SAMN05421720_1116 [Rhodospira trueperi]